MTASTVLTMIMVVFGICGMYAARKGWVIAAMTCIAVLAVSLVALAITLGWGSP